MGRQTLRITIVLGVLVTILGGTGIFATFTDRATAGQNSVTTGERPRAADLRIATVDPSVEPVGTTLCLPITTNFQDDTTTGQFAVGIGALQPGDNLPDRFVCLLNAGSGQLDIRASAIELQDTETDCTGDEAAAGDTTCGIDQTTGLPQAGELSPLLLVDIDRVSCSDVGTLIANSPAATLDQYASEQVVLGPGAAGVPLGPNEVACLRVRASYQTPTEEVSQRAQTDRAEWRFAFDATAR